MRWCEKWCNPVSARISVLQESPSCWGSRYPEVLTTHLHSLCPLCMMVGRRGSTACSGSACRPDRYTTTIRYPYQVPCSCSSCFQPFKDGTIRRV